MSSGTLKITVASAEIFKKRDAVNKGDFYVKLIYNGTMKETDVIKNSQNPRWDEAVDFNVSSSDRNRSILVELWDEDLVSEDEIIGSGKLPSIDKYLNNKEQVTIQMKNSSSSHEGNVNLVIKLVSGEGSKADEALPGVEEEEEPRKKKKKKHSRSPDGLGSSDSRGSLSSEGSRRHRNVGGTLRSSGGSRSALFGGESGTLRSRSGAATSMSRDHSGTLRYWEGASLGKSGGTQSTLRSVSSQGSQRIRDPNHPAHNFVSGGDDGSFSYTVDKYQTSPGPIYDLSKPIPIYDKNTYHATIGTEDRLKHFVTTTPGKGPDLIPNRGSTTFQPRPYYASFGKYTPPSWAISRSFTKEGPPENPPDISVKSQTPHPPQYGIPRDSRDKYFEKKSLSQGPAAYNNDREWTKPESGLGNMGKSERNTSSWIFGK